MDNPALTDASLSRDARTLADEIIEAGHMPAACSGAEWATVAAIESKLHGVSQKAYTVADDIAHNAAVSALARAIEATLRGVRRRFEPTYRVSYEANDAVTGVASSWCGLPLVELPHLCSPGDGTVYGVWVSIERAIQRDQVCSTVQDVENAYGIDLVSGLVIYRPASHEDVEELPFFDVTDFHRGVRERLKAIDENAALEKYRLAAGYHHVFRAELTCERSVCRYPHRFARRPVLEPLKPFDTAPSDLTRRQFSELRRVGFHAPMPQSEYVAREVVASMYAAVDAWGLSVGTASAFTG